MPLTKKTLPAIILTVIIVLFAIYMRLIDHPANFAPIGALSLFIGYYVSGKWKFALPVIILFLSDLFLGFYELGVLLSVYGSFVLISIIGHFLRSRSLDKTSEKIFGFFISTLAGSVLFFIITNTAVWWFSPWYEKTLDGLLLCFTLALPFFRNTLFGDIFYTAVFFTTMELGLYYLRHRALCQQEKKLIGRSVFYNSPF